MGSLTAEQVNEQAAMVASQVLNDSVIAAAHCEQVTQDQQMKAAGIGGGTRRMAKFGTKMNRAMMPSVGNMAKGLEGGGLPESFLLVVTKTQVHALEEKEKKGKLVPGKVLRSWDREGFKASLGNDAVNAASGVPEDRQALTLYLPLDGSKNKYLAASANMMAAAGSAGMPTRFQVAKDDASRAVAEELVGDEPAMPNIQVGGVGAAQAFGQPGAQGFGQPAAADSTAQLAQLAQLHASGALTDEEFAAQKAKIIGGG
jgi:putative oligomerization/nucleic acid binding protein